MPESTTSGATPADTPVTPPAQAATTTSPDAQAADGNTESITREEARKLRSEAKALRERLKAFEDADAAAKAAQMTEQERLQQQQAELQAANEDLAAALMEMNVQSDIARYAGKLNFIIDSPELLAQMLKWSEIEWDEESGKPLNIEKLLEQLAKAQPKLVQQQAQQQQMGTPATPAMNPGRSTITAPGSGAAPGRIPRLDDIQWKR